MEDQIKATIVSAESHVAAAYDKLEEMGAIMPEHKNIQNLRGTIYTLPLDVEKVTVTFDAGDGAPTPAAQELYPGQNAIEPVEPSKAGCIFTGWYAQRRAGGGQLTASEYNALNLTAAGYNNYGITAEEYNNNAKAILK